MENNKILSEDAKFCRLAWPQPTAALQHLVQQAQERNISNEELKQIFEWKQTNAILENVEWFLRFPTFTLVGDGPIIKSVLTPNMKPWGKEIFWKKKPTKK